MITPFQTLQNLLEDSDHVIVIEGSNRGPKDFDTWSRKRIYENVGKIFLNYSEYLSKKPPQDLSIEDILKLKELGIAFAITREYVKGKEKIEDRISGIYVLGLRRIKLEKLTNYIVEKTELGDGIYILGNGMRSVIVYLFRGHKKIGEVDMTPGNISDEIHNEYMKFSRKNEDTDIVLIIKNGKPELYIVNAGKIYDMEFYMISVKEEVDMKVIPLERINVSFVQASNIKVMEKGEFFEYIKKNFKGNEDLPQYSQ